MCILSCFLATLTGAIGFVIFTISLIGLILTVYLFRLSINKRTFRNKNIMFAPCDGKLINIYHNNNLNHYTFQCGFFHQYNQYAPCDAIVNSITNKGREVHINFTSQQNGNFSLIISTNGQLAHQTIYLYIKEGLFVDAGEHISSVAFGSTITLITELDLDIKLNNVVFANNSAIYN